MTSVLVTGGCGFIGSQFVAAVLRDTDWDVVVVDGLTYAGDTARLTDIFGAEPVGAELKGDARIIARKGPRGRVKVVWHDLRSPISPSVAKRLGEPDYIVHFAAQSHVDRSIEEPLDFVLGNPAITAHLLEWLRASTVETSCGVGKFWPSGRQLQQVIQFSTDEVYGPAPPGFMSKEWDPILPSNPYSASKAAQEAIAIAYWRTYGLPVSIVNVMNVFGPRQHPEKFMPMTIRAIEAGEPVTLHGRVVGTGREGESHTKAYAIVADGSGSWWEPSTRVWIHTDDVASALLALLDERPALYADGIPRPDRYHVAGPEEVDVHTLCQWIGVALNKQPIVKWVDYHSTRPGHDHRYALDATKIRETLGWQTKRSTYESVLDVVDWTMKNPHWL